MSVILGILILAIGVAALFIMIARELGVGGAAKVFGFAIVVTGAIVFAALLLTGAISF